MRRIQRPLRRRGVVIGIVYSRDRRSTICAARVTLAPMNNARAIGLGILAGVILAALGATELLRGFWLTLVGPRDGTVIRPGLIFSAYLFQTFVLVTLTFLAYNNDNHGIAAAIWVLATWEAIASILRQDLLLVKRFYPIMYDITAFLHVVAAAALFLAMGAKAYRRRREQETLRRLGAVERERDRG